MKKVLHRIQITQILRLFIVSLLFSATPLFAQEEAAAETVAAEAAAGGDHVEGKKLFNQNCAACHALDRNMTGPMLRNVEQRLMDEQGLGRDWLYKWIRNSAGLIASGDSYANQVYNEWNQTAMTAFPLLSDGDINNILAYTAYVEEGGDDDGGGIIVDPAPPVEPGISNEIILGALAFVLAVLVIMLFTVNSTLRRIAEANGIEVEKMREKRTPIWKAFAQNQFLVFVSVVFLLLASAYFAYAYMMQVGVDQGYEPVQPIHYSHRIHAGVNKIECTYCHSSARVSKHSGIPSLNVCMNCHKSIYEYTGNGQPPTQEDLANGYTNEFYTAQIKLLYEHVGWDETTQSYTGESKPVKWVRIHNLPDFAYFNHSQHVTVGEIECQTCHGPVEEMEIMYQYSPLTMGWCINCHRETNVKVADNGYYEKIHAQLSEKYEVEELTAAMMGGLECGKCHY